MKKTARSGRTISSKASSCLIMFCLLSLGGTRQLQRLARAGGGSPEARARDSTSPRRADVRRIDPRWVYRNQDLRCQRPPKPVESEADHCDNAEFAVFYPDGEVALVGCELYRIGKTGRLLMSAGDDFSVRKGRWSQQGRRIIVASQCTHGLRWVGSGPDPRLEQVTEIWTVRTRTKAGLFLSLSRGRRVFRAAGDVLGLKDLAPMIADDNLN
jgi:hypothetical protein